MTGLVVYGCNPRMRTTRLLLSSAVLLALGGCQDRSREAAPAVPSRPVTETEGSAPAKAPEGSDAPGSAMSENADAWTADKDLDGDGKPERIVLTGVQVKVGNDADAHTIFADGCEFRNEDSSLGFEARVVDFDKKDPRKELLVSCCNPDGEDECGHTLFGFVGGKIVANGIIADGDTELDVPGSGTLSMQRVDWEKKAEVLSTWTLKDGKLVAGPEKVIRKLRDEDMAACPFVYVAGAFGRERHGEILRNLRNASLETSQTLSLPARSVLGGKVRVRLAERKPETTFLDSVRLVVDGRSIAPESCGGAAAWCERDGNRHVMNPGDSLDLVFMVGDVAPGARIELEAAGYYVPQ